MKALWEVWEQKKNGRFRVQLVRYWPAPAIFHSPAYARLAVTGLITALAGREPKLECYIHPEGGYWASLWWDGKRRATVIRDHVVVFDNPCNRQQPAPQAKPSILPGDVAKRNARVKIVEAFEHWHLEHGGTLTSALKVWSALYREMGAGVSEETRALIPSISWYTLLRHRRNYLAGGSNALLPGKGGRTSSIEADPEIRDLVVDTLLYADPSHTTARHVQQILETKFPNRTQPGIASIRRFIRRWRTKRAEDGDCQNREDLSAV